MTPYDHLAATPQTGIFAHGTASHAYLELRLRPAVAVPPEIEPIRRLGRITAGQVEQVERERRSLR